MRLYYYPSNASLTPHVVLEELGIPYELALVDRTANAHKSPEYLALNPTGRIPVLVDGDLVVFETAAIVLHLLDMHDGSHALAPPLRTPERARFYQFIMYLTNTVQAEMHPFFYPDQHTSDPAGVPHVKAKAEARLTEMFALIEAELVARGPFLLGERYSALDIYLAMLIRWGRHFAHPPRELPRVGRLARAVGERSAFRRAMEQEGLSEPFFGP
jgi:glutathione S-transferase